MTRNCARISLIAILAMIILIIIYPLLGQMGGSLNGILIGETLVPDIIG
jgi:hypothetical protein